MECLARTVPGWEDAGCNVDTGIPASIIAKMIKEGLIKEKGSFVPETVVPEEAFFEELRKWGMIIYMDGKELTSPAGAKIPVASKAAVRS
jgi:saccharopine dehydrogenase-like NADP-dependent oxidoreductase